MVTWIDLDLTLPQLKTLLFIAEHGPTNTKMIAGRFGVTSSNVTRTIDVLVKQKLVTRRENPADRRILELRLTEKGEKTIDTLLNASDKIKGFMANILKTQNIP